MKPTGSTKIIGIIGCPISHSISPQMHNAALKFLGLDIEYVPFEVKPENLRAAIDGMRAEGLLGFNVTIPHKEAIVPLLDEVTRLPRIIGAVNTVVNESGKLIGYNTDGAGFIESLRSDAGVDPQGKKIVLLGAGGAAKAVAVMLAESKARSIILCDVDQKKADTLSEYVGSLFDSEVKSLEAGSGEIAAAIRSSDIIVNATPIGMHPNEDKMPGDERWEMRGGSVLFDLVYNPPETKLMKYAKKSGAKAVNGLGMLVRQGAKAFEIWTGHEAPVDVMMKAAKEALNIR